MDCQFPALCALGDDEHRNSHSHSTSGTSKHVLSDDELCVPTANRGLKPCYIFVLASIKASGFCGTDYVRRPNSHVVRLEYTVSLQRYIVK